MNVADGRICARPEPRAGCAGGGEPRNPLQVAATRAVFHPRRSLPPDLASRRFVRGGFRRWSEAVDVDPGQLVARGLDDIAIVMRLHELVPTRRRASRRRPWRRLERLAQVHEYLPDRRGVGDEGDQSDVTAAGGAREREVFRDPRDERGPGDSRGVVGTGRCALVGLRDVIAP